VLNGAIVQEIIMVAVRNFKTRRFVRLGTSPVWMIIPPAAPRTGWMQFHHTPPQEKHLAVQLPVPVPSTLALSVVMDLSPSYRSGGSEQAGSHPRGDGSRCYDICRSSVLVQHSLLATTFSRATSPLNPWLPTPHNQTVETMSSPH